MRTGCFLRAWTRALAVSILAAAPTSLRAQALPPAPAGSARPATTSTTPRWNVRPVVELVSEYDDNVYLLSADKRPDVADPSSGAVAAGRYAGMASAGDVITTLSAAMKIAGPGLGGRDLVIRPEVAYAAYARNAERRNLALSVTAEQELARGRRLRLKADATPSYFARNYLVDAVDANASGTIESGERRYAPGTYREHAAALEYRHRLRNSTKKRPFGASLEVGAGYYGRAYDAALAGRDVAGPSGQAALLLTLTRRTGLDLRYGYASLGATPTMQVMVIDEADAGRDLNANGSTNDANVRVEARADRSHGEHVFDVRLDHELTKRVSGRLEVERRRRAFGSTEPLDLSNNGRSDTRSTVGGELSMRLLPDVRLVGAASYATQQTTRGTDAGVNDVDDYDRLRFSIGFRYAR